ncbi:MAG: methyltransferase domain-containing protein [Phycisphaerales bacterium]
MSGWWKTFFDETYAEIGLVTRQGQQADAFADSVIRLLDLKPGERVFDQCCGIGRIAIPLARRGMVLEGVDLAQSYVDAAARTASQESLHARFVCADGYSYVASAPCDAAINVFTSFGYSDDDAQNEAMMRRAFESLRSGGRFLLERINPCWVVTFGLLPNATRIPTGSGDDILAVEEPVADWHRGTILSRWSIFFPDGRRDVRNFETRMLFPNELVAMAKRVGFVDIALLSSVDGAAYDRHARRLLMTARRA